MSIRFLIPILAISVVTVSPAHAQQDRPGTSIFEKRQATYKRGIKAMLARDWIEAERIFSALWIDQRSWDVAVSLGQCELNLKRYRDAAEHLTIGLKLFPVRDKRELFDAAKAGLEEAKKHIGMLGVEVNRADANILVDGKLVGRSPLQSEIFVEPGARTIEAQLEGFETAKREIFAEAGKEQSVDLELTPHKPTSAVAEPPVAPLQPPPQDSALEVTTVNYGFNWIPAAVGGAVALGGVGMFVGFTVAANSDEDEIEALRDELDPSACAPSAAAKPAQCDAAAEAGRSFDRNRNWATLGLVVAGTAIVSTTAYYFLESALSSPVSKSSSFRNRHSARLDATVLPGFAGMSVLGTFE